MKISGFQKLTLLDYPELMACIVFTHGCNFRCPFCHNGGLVVSEQTDNISGEEILSYLKKRSAMLEGVVISGGEPTLQSDLPDFLRKIKALGYRVKLDTNGTSPEKISALINEGLVDHIAMDVKSSLENYRAASGISAEKYLPDIKKSIEILKSGAIEHEFRTTLVKGIHAESDVISVAKLINGDDKFYLQSYKRSDGVINPDGLSSFSEKEMKSFAEKAKKFCPNVQLRI